MSSVATPYPIRCWLLPILVDFGRLIIGGLNKDRFRVHDVLFNIDLHKLAYFISLIKIHQITYIHRVTCSVGYIKYNH